MPKSTSLGTTEPEVSGTSMMFSGLRSRWTMPLAWALGESGGARDREERGDGVRGGEAALALEHLAQRLAAEHLHDDERIIELGLAEVEHAHDGSVPDARRGPRLLEQAARGLGRRQLAADELDRDVHVELEVPRQPHGAHAALAEHAGQAVLLGDDVPREVMVPRGARRRRGVFLVLLGLGGGGGHMRSRS